MQITPNPTPEEAAAIAAVVAIVTTPNGGAVDDRSDDTLHLWLEVSRRSAQRAGMQRGPWRMSGRIARRSRV